MQFLWPAFAGHEWFLITYRSQRTEELSLMKRTYLLSNIGSNIILMLKVCLQATSILLRERPDIVLSTGAEIAIPFLWIGRILGARTVYIESWCRIRSKSATGPLVYPVSDLFLVQWPSLLNEYGPNARYEGALL